MLQNVHVHTPDGVVFLPEVAEVEIDEGALYVRSAQRTVVFAPGGWSRSEATPARS